MPCFFFVFRQSLLYRYSHKEEIEDDRRASEQISKQHSVIPIAYDEKNSLHYSAEYQCPHTDICCFTKHYNVYFCLVFYV